MSKNANPTNAAVWFEIGVKNLDRGADFFGSVLGTPLKRETMGENAIAIFPYNGGVSGNLYQGSDFGGVAPVVHLSAPSPLEDALARVGQLGGKVTSEIRQTPDGGRFAYCADPDGTRFGLYTPA